MLHLQPVKWEELQLRVIYNQIIIWLQDEETEIKSYICMSGKKTKPSLPLRVANFLHYANMIHTI